MYNTPMLVVGLTGNYGMGKSTVLGIFRELGAVTLKADEIVASLLCERTVQDRLREMLGEDIFSDGALDKAKIAELIFRSKERKEAVEGLLHPLVFKKIDSFLEDLQRRGGGERMVVIEIPLLFESGYAGKIGQTITVVAGEEIALRRLGKTGVSRESGMARMKTQMPISEKVAKSDFTIENSGTPEETRAQVVALYNRLLEEVRAS